MTHLFAAGTLLAVIKRSLAAIPALALFLVVVSHAGARAQQGTAGSSPALMAAQPLRMAEIAPAPAACAAPDASNPGARAFADHVGGRLGRTVQLCAFQDRMAAAQALARGEIDIAELDADSFAETGAAARALLARREPRDIGRILSMAAVPAASVRAALADMAAARVIYGGSISAFYSGPRTAAADHGAPVEAFASEIIAASPEEAMARLRANEADAIILHASAWQRLCRPAKIGDTPCADLKEIWRGRARPASAWAVRKDMDREIMFRLVGVLVAIHLENKAALEWLAPGAPELNPVEATALDIGRVSGAQGG